MTSLQIDAGASARTRIAARLLPFLFIMKEPDLGSALVLLPTGLMMLYAAGTPKTYLLQLLGLVGLLFVHELGHVLELRRQGCRPRPRYLSRSSVPSSG